VDEWQINLAQAWQRGKNIDWSRVAPQDGGQRLALPAYPFARTWPERGNT